MLSVLVKNTVSSFTTEADAQAVEAFFREKDTKSFDQALQQGLDAIRASAKWLERDSNDVEQWLREHQYL
jgi:aminopeptidase 2